MLRNIATRGRPIPALPPPQRPATSLRRLTLGSRPSFGPAVVSVEGASRLLLGASEGAFLSFSVMALR
eukprot:9224698-Alexandrium_andersonii.AAC.1